MKLYKFCRLNYLR